MRTDELPAALAREARAKNGSSSLTGAPDDDLPDVPEAEERKPYTIERFRRLLQKMKKGSQEP